MDLHTAKSKDFSVNVSALCILLLLGIVSLFVGRFHLSLTEMLQGDDLQRRVFWTLRVSRTIVGLFGGFALGVSGFVFQTIFRNPLASPDIIGISSGASAGAAVGILFLTGTAAVTASAFTGAVLALILTLLLSSLNRNSRSSTLVLAGIAVHSLTQTLLICLKLTADPERQLASIEYWIMGSLNGISLYSIAQNMLVCMCCTAAVFMLHRQVVMLSADEDEARLLGVNVSVIRLVILLIATLATASIISLTGLISFVGLLAPHISRLITKNNRISTMLLSGSAGGILLTGADILARSVAASELPVSIFTSLLGAPFLIYLIYSRRQSV